MTKRRENKGRIGLMPMLMLVLVLVICYVSVITVLTPKRYDVAIGAAANESINAPRAVEDVLATDALRAAARNGVREVYQLDEALIEQYVNSAAGFFDDVISFRQEAEQMRLARAAETGLRAEGALTVEEWSAVLTGEELLRMMERFELSLSPEDGWWLLHVEDGELLRWQDAVLPKLTVSLRAGVEERSLAAKKSAFVQELNATGISKQLKTIGEKTINAYLQPTFVPDERATEQLRESAEASVEPVHIKRGDVIVQRGETVTQEKYELLKSLELVRSEKSDVKLSIGVALYLLSMVGVFGAYLLLYRRTVLGDKKSMLIIGILVSLTVLLALVFNILDPHITPGLIGVMLIALLVDKRAAMAVNILLSFCVALLAGGRGASMLGFESITMAASMLAGGQVAIYLIGGQQKRGTIIVSGLAAGVASALVIIASYVMTEKTVGVTLIACAWALGSSVISAVLVVGTLTLWENLFDVATSARLNELTNTNNPLLKQLMTEAPGTYHHSVMTAALAEGAAEAIGADALLARVGAYYHDVGKLKRPIYFKENQKPDENIHDSMPPGESATVIISHLKDGVMLLNKYKLPSAVVQIAYEHHGTTMAAYFYHKAVKEAGGKPVQQKLFRYPGGRPSTKESVIVMLADSCEAAVRSLDNPTREAVEELVDKIIKGKIEDGQLAMAPIDFQDLTVIQQSFLHTFTGLLHERLAYPDKEGGN